MRICTVFGLLFVACVMAASSGCGEQNASPVTADKTAAVKSAAVDTTKPTDQWSYGDVEAHLASKGWETSRHHNGESKRENERVRFFEGEKHLFDANDYASPEAAAKEASRLVDVHRENAFAWNRFVFVERSLDLSALPRLKKLLP